MFVNVQEVDFGALLQVEKITSCRLMKQIVTATILDCSSNLENIPQQHNDALDLKQVIILFSPLNNF